MNTHNRLQDSTIRRFQRNIPGILSGALLFLITLSFLAPLPLWGQATDQLPRKAKMEAVLYKNADMVGMGYRYKEQFVENQKVEFFKLHNAEKYKVKKKKGEYYVAGENKMLPVTSLQPLLPGTYFTMNGIPYVKGKWYPKGMSMYKGTFLVYGTGNGIRPINIQEFFVETNTATLSGESQDKSTNYQLEIRFINNRIEKITCEISKDFLIEKIREEGVRNVFFNQQAEGDMIYNCLLHIEQEETPVNILFKNRNQFNGNIKLNSKDVIPTQGIYKYVTGETFNGTYEDIFWDSRNGTVHIPTQGIMTFTDGTVAQGDWLKRYGLREEDWTTLYKEGDSPTTIRDKAARKQQELAEAKRMKKEEEQQQRLAELQEKQEQERRKTARRKQLITKYGEHYGTLISQGELELGMTTEMVNEVWDKDFFDRDQFIVSGNKVEVWTFNEDNMAETVARKEGKEGLMTMLFINQIGGLFGVDYGNPSQLTFTNGRLTGIIK